MSARDKIKVCSESENGEIILLGQPNVGKSVIFSALTGKYVYVCNYPGTTVEISRGNWNGYSVVDAPGINSLTPTSEDEIVTRNVILSGKAACLVQVADSKNLKRSLRLTLQAATFRLPMIMILNMEDEALALGITIDAEKLSRELGIPVIKTVATEGRGLSEVKNAIENAKVPEIRVDYPGAIEEAAEKISELLKPVKHYYEALSLALLEGDAFIRDVALKDVNSENSNEVINQIETAGRNLSEPPSLVMPSIRASHAWRLADRVSKQKRRKEVSWLVKVGRITDHPVYGFGVLGAVLFLMYQLVGVFAAGTLVDFFENVIFGQWLIPPVTWIVEGVIPSDFIRQILIGEFGLISMGLTYALAIVLPIVVVYFLVFGFLEDSGYLPRLSILLNKAFRMIGLNGKAVLPMILGLGCGTMAIMTTRILDSRKERLIATILLALAVPCSAQLGVIMGMLSAINPLGTLWFFGVIVLQLIIVGKLAFMVLPGEKSEFIAEIPPIRIPVMRNIILKTAYRTEWFIKEAVPLFLLGTLILFFFDRYGVNVLLERLLQPVVSGWLGLPVEASQSLLMGFLRRDYGAAGFYTMQKAGLLNPQQVVVALTTITLFVPCIASLLVMIKERGFGTAMGVMAFIMPYALFVGGLLRMAMTAAGGL